MERTHPPFRMDTMTYSINNSGTLSCDACSALVINKFVHTRWHETLTTLITEQPTLAVDWGAPTPDEPTPGDHAVPVPDFPVEPVRSVLTQATFAIHKDDATVTGDFPMSADVKKALDEFYAARTLSAASVRVTPKAERPLPARDVAVEELARVYENASGSEYPDYFAVRRGIEAVVDRVFKYLDLGK